MPRWSIALTSLVAGGLIGALLAAPFLLQGQPPTPTPIPKEMTSYRDVVKKVLPAVVMIEAKAKPTSRKSGSRRRPLDENRMPEELRKFFEDFQRQQFDDEDSPNLGLGSGFVVDPQGVILTNNHVVEGADEVEVNFKDGRKYTSKDIKTDAKTDLAIVRIDAKAPLPYLEMGDSDAMEIGDRVLAVGAPFGLSGSVTCGIVSAKGRNLHMNMYEDFLQTDAAINPGNSGGPLVNLEGRVIGINSAIKSRSGGFQGVGLAISSNLARNIMQQLLKEGVVHRGYLGVQIKDVTDGELARRLGVEENGGVLVTQVFDGSPSAKAGLQEGDVITGLGGKPIKESSQLQRAVATLPLGKPVELSVVRDGKPKTLEVTIQEQPRDFGASAVPSGPERGSPRREKSPVSLEKVGLEVTDLSADLADQLGYSDKAKGALITQVDSDSAASKAGLRRGMLITKVEKHTVSSARALRDELDKADLAKGALVQVQTPEGASNLVVLKVADEKQ